MNDQMSSEEIQITAFNIILHSGNAKTKIHSAFELMRKGEFDKANQLLDEANDDILEAHESQTGLLQSLIMGLKLRWKSLWFMLKII